MNSKHKLQKLIAILIGLCFVALGLQLALDAEMKKRGYTRRWSSVNHRMIYVDSEGRAL